ncbi:hypothetical protein D3C72_1935020 [compost metagenome]
MEAKRHALHSNPAPYLDQGKVQQVSNQTLSTLDRMADMAQHLDSPSVRITPQQNFRRHSYRRQRIA